MNKQINEHTLSLNQAMQAEVQLTSCVNRVKIHNIKMKIREAIMAVLSTYLNEAPRFKAPT